jgi:predicted transcriptional regulator
MRTTVDLNDDLGRRVKLLASRRRTTMRALIEEGLRRVLQEHSAPASDPGLPDASVGGDGLGPGVDDLSWATLSRFIYPPR